MSDWMPDDDDVEVYFALGATEYKVGGGGMSISEAHDAYRAWLAAHDRELRERIAQDIEAYAVFLDRALYPASTFARIARGEGSE